METRALRSVQNIFFIIINSSNYNSNVKNINMHI